MTGEAREGSIVTNSSDNRKTYNNNVSSTIQVQQMVVRDEQDIRSLAVEIATLTRRQQQRKGASRNGVGLQARCVLTQPSSSSVIHFTGSYAEASFHNVLVGAVPYGCH